MNLATANKDNCQQEKILDFHILPTHFEKESNSGWVDKEKAREEIFFHNIQKNLNLDKLWLTFSEIMLILTGILKNGIGSGEIFMKENNEQMSWKSSSEGWVASI